VLLDQRLVAVDIYGSLAHAKMLQKQGLIHINDLKNLQHGLLEILKKCENGDFVLQLGDEDVHTKIESELTQHFPEAGARLHTGRSRNDQVLVDLRLYTKTQQLLIIEKVLQLAEHFCDKATELSEIPLPGMTHMQPAMLSSFGLWLAAFAESLIDDLTILEAAYTHNDQSPLGSGAAYGVTLPLDRVYTAKLLGFAKVQNNALYCQNSRGKIEASMLHSLSQVMATLNKFATDCLFFTTEPFSFITFAKELGTGSSIMPQKQNWDALELMRAKYHQVNSAQLLVSNSAVSLPSGYNRDLQLAKGSLMQAIETTSESLSVAELFIHSLTPNQSQIVKHIPRHLFAAHWAYVLVQEQQMPFRKAYMYVKNHLEEIPDFDLTTLLYQATSQGSTGNLQLSELGARIHEKKRQWTTTKAKFEHTITHLISE